MSSMEPHSAQSAEDCSEAEEDWWCTHAGQQLEKLDRGLRFVPPEGGMGT